MDTRSEILRTMKQSALSSLLGVNSSEIQVKDSEFTVGSEVYNVFTDDEATEQCVSIADSYIRDNLDLSNLPPNLHAFIELDKVIDEYVGQMGRGALLANVDQRERIEDEFYIYRVH